MLQVRPWGMLLSALLLMAAMALNAEIKFTIKPSEGNTSHNIIYLFAHGLGSNQHQGMHVLKSNEHTRNRWVLHEPLALFNFLDVVSEHKLEKTDFLRKKVCLGQEDDLACLHEAYLQVRNSYPEYGIVLVGISRGAAVILNYLALYSPRNIQAAVLESPFDSLSSIIKHLLWRYKMSWLPFGDIVAHKICCKYFPRVDPKGVFPAKVTDKIDQNIPIILVHSRKDKVIPITSSRNLYLKLKQQGNQHVYLVELAAGSHGRLLHGPDADFYFYSVQAFYKKYGLFHDSDAASRGEYLLTTRCQPDITYVKRAFLPSEQEDDEEEILETIA